MDVSTIATGGGSAGVAVIVLKIIEKVPWGKLIGRPSKNGKGISEPEAKVLIYEHKEKCMEAIEKKIDSIGKTFDEKHTQFEKRITQTISRIMLNGGRLDEGEDR